MTDYWDKCEKARAVADKFSVDSIKKVAVTKTWLWRVPLNKFAYRKLGIKRHELWEPRTIRPIALGAPEYEPLLRRPAIIKRDWNATNAPTRILYLLVNRRALVFHGYDGYPFYLLFDYTSGQEGLVVDIEIHRRIDPEFLAHNPEYTLYTSLESGGCAEGILDKPYQPHLQRVMSFMVLAMLSFYTVYKDGVEYLALKPKKSGNHKEYVNLHLLPDDIRFYSEIETAFPVVPPGQEPIKDDMLDNARLIYTPCEVYDALRLLSKKFSLVIYEAPETGDLAVVDKDYLQEASKRNDVVNAVVIEANDPDKAEEHVMLLTAYRLPFNPWKLKGEPISLDEIKSPEELYETAVLSRLD